MRLYFKTPRDRRMIFFIEVGIYKEKGRSNKNQP
jgi:hypothetical protein